MIWFFAIFLKIALIIFIGRIICSMDGTAWQLMGKTWVRTRAFCILLNALWFSLTSLWVSCLKTVVSCRISWLLPRLPKLPYQYYSHSEGNMGSNKEIQPDILSLSSCVFFCLFASADCGCISLVLPRLLKLPSALRMGQSPWPVCAVIKKSSLYVVMLYIARMVTVFSGHCGKQ